MTKERKIIKSHEYRMLVQEGCHHIIRVPLGHVHGVNLTMEGRKFFKTHVGNIRLIIDGTAYFDISTEALNIMQQISDTGFILRRNQMNVYIPEIRPHFIDLELFIKLSGVLKYNFFTWG